MVCINSLLLYLGLYPPISLSYSSDCYKWLNLVLLFVNYFHQLVVLTVNQMKNPIFLIVHTLRNPVLGYQKIHNTTDTIDIIESA